MATLFNTKISATYEGLFKTIDNAAITASLKELTDGSGNQSGLYVNNAGDFKVSNILEWGSLKDTGTGVTITRYVTSTDGIENFDNNTSLPTSAAVKLYVDSKFATSDTLQEVLSFGNTTGGNDIAVSAGDDITFTDSSKAIFGAGSDLQIYHDSSNISYIKHNSSSDFRIQTSSTGYIKLMAELENMAVFIPNSAVELYFDNSKKLATTNTGVDVTGNLVVSGSITGAGGSFLPLAGGTMTGNIVLNDNVKSIYGTAGDGLEIYHDGSDSYINDTGTGSLIIRSADNIKLETNAAELYFQGIKDGAVKLYYDNAEKLVTSSTGVSVTGALSTTSNISVGANATFVDNGKAIFGAGSDLQIYHNGTNQDRIESSSAFLVLESSNVIFRNNGGAEDYAKFLGNGAIELYYDGTKRLETLTDGAKVTGNLEVTGTITGSGGSFLPLAGGTMTGDTIHNDNVKSIYGTASDFEIYHDGSNSYIKESGTGDFRIWADNPNISSLSGNKYFYGNNGSAELYHSGNKKLATTSTGISVTGNVVGTGDFRIADNKQLQLGANPDLILFHNATDSYIRNNTGDFYFEQAAVTKSIVFKVSDANSLDTTALTISRNADASFGRDVTIAGDLTVNGTTTTVNSQTLAVVDPLIQLAKDNTANSLDIGLYGDYNDGTDRFLGLFSDASDSNKFKLFKGTTVEPTTTVDIGGAGYVAADLQVAGLEATTGHFSSTGAFGGVVTIESYIVHAGDTDSQFGFQAADEFRISIGGDLNFLADANGNYLYHNALQKMRTTSGGVFVTGDAVASSTVIVGTNGSIFAENNLRFKAASDAYIDQNTIGQSIRFRTSSSSSLDTEALLISASGNATFAGEISAGQRIKIGSGGTYQAGSIYSDSNYGMIFRALQASPSSADFLFTNSANVARLTIDSSGNSTFAGETYFNKGVRFYRYTDQANFWSVYTNTDDSLRFNYNGSGNDEIIIDSSGNSTFAGLIDAGGRLKVSGGDTDQYYFEGARDGVGVTYRLYDNANNIYHDSYSSQVIRVNQLGGSGGGFFFSGGDFNLTTTNVHINGGTSYNDKSNLNLSNGRTIIQSDIVDATANGDTSLNFQTRKSGATSSAMFIDEFRNIGISSTNPSAFGKFVVEGSGNLLNLNATSGKVYQAFYENGVGRFYLNTLNGSDGLAFTDADGSTERMRISALGNVGIGQAPTDFTNWRVLELKGLTNGSMLNFENSSSVRTGAIAMNDASSLLRLQTMTASGIAFEPNNAEAMRIDSSGDVTIGNFTPGNPSRLNVRGSGTYNTTFTRPGATVQIISDELTNDTWSPVLNIANVRQSLTTGKDSFGGIGFSSIDDSNNAGIFDAARIALINEVPGSVTTPTALAFYTNVGTTQSGAATERMRITSGGIVKIDSGNLVGTGNGIHLSGARVNAIDNNGTTADNSSYLGYSSGRWIAVYAVTGTIQTSDVREKTEIKSTQLGLDFVNDLNPVSYKWIDGKRQSGEKTIKDKRQHQGLIAQEVAKTLEKHGVNKNEFGGLDIQKTDKYDDFHGMSYEQLVAPMIKAIQELTAKVEMLEKNCQCKN